FMASKEQCYHFIAQLHFGHPLAGLLIPGLQQHCNEISAVFSVFSLLTNPFLSLTNQRVADLVYGSQGTLITPPLWSRPGKRNQRKTDKVREAGVYLSARPTKRI